MDFHGMKRKDLQTLCKKHGIPGNLKNIEMATRLAYVFQKETVNIPEDSVEADGIKDDVVVRKEAKRVRFSPQNEVFEFTRSVKKCQLKNVRMSSQGHALQQGGIEIELRRSKRIVAKGITVARPNKNESNTRRAGLSDVTKALEVPRRLKRIGSSGSTKKDCKVSDLMALEQFEFEDISEGLENNGRRSTRLKAKTLLPAKRSQRLVDTKNEDELVKNNVKDVSMDVQDDPKVEKVPRLSRRFVNGIDVQTNTQDRRRSIRFKARAANSSMGGETSDGGPLCSAKEGKKETKTKQSEGSTVVKSQEGKESLIDCEVRTTENYGRMKLQDVSKVEKVPRRRRKDINVLMDKRPVKAAKREKSLSELLVDGQAQKGAKQPNRTFGNDRADKKLPPSSKHTALDNMSNSLKSCSVMDCERDGASVGNVKKPNVNDETQIRVRFSRNSSRHDSFKAPILVEGNLVDKKMDETLKKKQDRSAEPGMDIETKSTQSNLTQIELLDQYAQFEQEAAGSTNVAYGGSSRKSKTMNRECVKDMPQGMIENSPSSSETKAAEAVMVIESVLDSTPEKSVHSSQRTDTQELNSELMERKREEKLEHDTILMPVIEECKEEVLLIERLSPALVPLAISNPEAELVVPTSHSHVRDIGSTVIVKENTKTKEEIFICGPISELKENSSVAKLGNIKEGSGPSTDVQNQIHDAKEELALTDNTEADELIEAGGSYVSGKTCVLAGAEGEHLSLNSEVDFRNTCEKSVPKFLKDEAADSIEKAISVTSDELTVQNNMNEKAADEEMIRRETTPSPEETLHDSSENKEYLNIDESGEKQVRREPILIYRTQVKLKRHDMKENAPNSKIVDNLNVTAPRTSKRQLLQDLRKN